MRKYDSNFLYLVIQYNKNAIDKYCNGYRVEKIFFDEDDWWDDTDFRDGWKIIAWMPLPSPYIATEDKQK